MSLTMSAEFIEARLDQMGGCLENYIQDWDDDDGGCPRAEIRVESHVVTATVDHRGQPQITVYCGDVFLEWQHAADAFLREHEDDSIRYTREDALEECRPAPCRCERMDIPLPVRSYR